MSEFPAPTCRFLPIGCLVPLLHVLAIAAVILAGPGWLGLVAAIRSAVRDDRHASRERDTARADQRLAA